MNITSTSRPFCYRCDRPQPACVCASIPQVNNRTTIYLLQHPRERFHPFGSVRFARLGLARLALDVYGEAFAHQRTWSAAAPAGAALLFPGPAARELSELDENERPSGLVVIDGTWSHAKSILKKTPCLAALPQVKVRPRAPGLYRIRREPALHCMSTIEAIIEALRVLEPNTPGLDELLAAFVGMIDRHLDLRTQSTHAPFRRTRRQPH
jgi:DTW domain-containing protein YfiP